jgi:hypothetical protein
LYKLYTILGKIYTSKSSAPFLPFLGKTAEYSAADFLGRSYFYGATCVLRPKFRPVGNTVTCAIVAVFCKGNLFIISNTSNFNSHFKFREDELLKVLILILR